MTAVNDFTLAELIIAACAQAWHGDGEVLATGIGPLPRLAAGLAKLTFAPGLMMTDGEAYLVEDPVPLGPRGDYAPKFSGWMPYGRVFDSVWSGRRHAMVTPVQLDRYGQGNISALGGSFDKPKVAMLGVRGFPGNSICHKNSMFMPNHTKRAFVEGEVDVVASVGYNEKNWPAGAKPADVKLGIVVTDLCVLDFNGRDHAAQVLSLHPGVTFEQVQAATGFPVLRAAAMTTTPAPTSEQLTIIGRLDPHNIRATVLKGNPPGIRAA
ncbi:ketoacid CoA transferase [Bradyrhizobium sp. U87765 SZCCT0131]|uniref:CoA-transferase subunit beta n=1 Tax=unclassified Bradyrhizobium TaxID=2631580 RepID=UPI001BABEA00|nr:MULTISPECIES: ketoacid CoA transferase [unclassified Bradyrhizobium]MBR1217989.1 ketoacid CoA transferase [Bradyrhizobium sp. U87765 SZCCT0131]MBR1261065.1 ketoacid CoA transferase [Bradyrhizobium sp. U87765 SZCCT0134]MBR1303487.1 ketoacid CoA transferase [Bradyrhizobium sp. U87765 SZCCT0110]MBR1319093.1 ketoacid CoA transferase [Bradyrhizobium sp. U87765 SZCCT0109]MBR1347418.1 ketoacid CoA transferase [Bradyrhizobium sp. U87765 SZCCT0048]